MSKHTPGPWKYSTEPQPNGCPIIGAQGLMIAMLAHTVKQADQRETALANARLIACAPELLEALNKLVDHIDFIPTDPYYRNETKELMDAARAAIAKAEGEQK